MNGRNNFNKLREEIERDPARKERMIEQKKAYDALLTLASLRQSRGITQAELAALLDVSQPNISKIEHGEEIHLSTLSEYVEALGGRLELKAVFDEHPEDDVTVKVGNG